jgi:hypothetical protein
MRHRRTVPHRFEAAGCVPVRNPKAKDGLWVHDTRRRINRMFRQACGAKGEQLRYPIPGDWVLCFRNDYIAGVLNGKIWQIEDLFNDNGNIHLALIDEDGRKTSVEVPEEDFLRGPPRQVASASVSRGKSVILTKPDAIIRRKIARGVCQVRRKKGCSSRVRACHRSAASHSCNFDQRCRVRAPLTAIASAWRWPTSTTRRLPRVTPV